MENIYQKTAAHLVDAPSLKTTGLDSFTSKTNNFILLFLILISLK